MRNSTLANWARAFLFPRPFIGIVYLPRYFKNFIAYKRASPKERVRPMDSYPCLVDWTVSTPFDGHYFYQGAWLSRRLTESVPDLHIDIGSSVMMISVLSAVTKTIFVDYRPLHAHLSGLSSVGASITRLPFRDNSVSSLSCLHVIEHVGLGRYGDPIDPRGSDRAAAELERILAPGGRLYLSLPVGHERVCFNAHRVHAPESVPHLVPSLRCVEFAYVDDDGRYSEGRPQSDVAASNYACGMYVLEKQYDLSDGKLNGNR